MRGLLVAVTGMTLLCGCQMPRPLLQTNEIGCPKYVQTPPTGSSLLFVTVREPDCRATGELPKLTDLRARNALFVASDDGVLQFFSQNQWLAALDRRIPDKGKPLILFIHGYRNSNADALSAAAKIALALKGREQVVSLTWPSYGRYTSYFWDETNADWASAIASGAVVEMVRRFPYVIIIAHSMGNRVALGLMDELRRHGLTAHVDHLVMASPDVDRSSLERVLSGGLGTRVTIYGSRRDQALSASWRAHSYPRGGDLSWWVTGRKRDDSLAWLPNVEVVDTTEIDHSVSGHSAFIETREGAEDLCRLVDGHGSGRPSLEPLKAHISKAPENYFRLVQSSSMDDCNR